jgi:hypothetical protein
MSITTIYQENRTTTGADRVENEHSNFGDLRTVLTDERFGRTQRLLRLQGWRGAELSAAARAGAATHLGPAVCAALAWVVVATGSLPIAVFTLVTSVVGVLAANHPVETLYNVFARRTGRGPIPRNRAGKRLGCAIGTLFFGATSIAFVADQMLVGRVIVGSMALVATFVAITGVCVPSIMFTLAFGANKATAPSLAAAVRTPALPAPVAGGASTTWVPVEGYRA